MGDAYWPSSFPAPDRNDFGHAPMDVAERTDMKFGPPRVRQMQTTPTYSIQNSWTFTQAGYAAFMEFYSYALSQGTKPFYAPIYRAGSFEDHLVQFAGPYQSDYISQSEVMVRAKLTVLDVFVPTPASSWTLAAVAFISSVEFGDTKRVSLVTPPNPHRPMKVEVRFEQTFAAAGAVALMAGRSVSATPNELLNITDARAYAAPNTLTVVDGHAAEGSRLNVLQNNADAYVIRLSGSTPTAGRASVALYWTTA